MTIDGHLPLRVKLLPGGEIVETSDYRIMRWAHQVAIHGVGTKGIQDRAIIELHDHNMRRCSGTERTLAVYRGDHYHVDAVILGESDD